MSTENHPDPDQKKIIQLYVVFGICLVLTVIPHIWAAVLSILSLLYVLIAAYIWRKRRPEDSLMANHMTFIIRTIWLSGFYAAFTLIAASAYLLSYIDNTPLNPCINKFINMGQAAVSMTDMEAVSNIFSGCMNHFIQANFSTLIVSLIIAGGPLLLYFAFRFVRGLSRARDGYRVAKPKAWF